VLRTRGIFGVLVGSLPNEQKELSLNWPALAAVAQSHSLQRPALSRALSDYAFNMQMAIGELRRMGYRRVGYVFAPKLEERTEGLHLAAYLEDQFRVPGAQRVPPFNWSEKSPEQLAHWLAGAKPEAVLSHDLDLVNVIRKLGYRVPRDIGVAALNLSPATEQRTPRSDRLAGVDQQLERCGAVAVNLLISHLHHHEMGPPAQPVIALTRGRWIPGDTLRRAK
ncbi:MAG: substrate-binding domain-containing protein, partial [Chthoniobacteraceae bacterium]